MPALEKHAAEDEEVVPPIRLIGVVVAVKGYAGEGVRACFDEACGRFDALEVGAPLEGLGAYARDALGYDYLAEARQSLNAPSAISVMPSGSSGQGSEPR